MKQKDVIMPHYLVNKNFKLLRFNLKF